MFCPRCGDQMFQLGGVYHCERGEMELSVLTADELIEAFLDTPRAEHFRPIAYEPDVKLFCPRCGVEMRKGNGMIQCPRCGRCLNRFVRQLMELHPHRDERGMWPWH